MIFFNALQGNRILLYIVAISKQDRRPSRITPPGLLEFASHTVLLCT